MIDGGRERHDHLTIWGCLGRPYTNGQDEILKCARVVDGFHVPAGAWPLVGVEVAG
jgi:hypothetical protein